MNVSAHKWLLISMFSEACGDRSKSSHGAGLSALLRKEDLTWQGLRLPLLQEYSYQRWTNFARDKSNKSATVASSWYNKDNKKKYSKNRLLVV